MGERCGRCPSSNNLSALLHSFCIWFGSRRISCGRRLVARDGSAVKGAASACPPHHEFLEADVTVSFGIREFEVELALGARVDGLPHRQARQSRNPAEHPARAVAVDDKSRCNDASCVVSVVSRVARLLGANRISSAGLSGPCLATLRPTSYCLKDKTASRLAQLKSCPKGEVHGCTSCNSKRGKLKISARSDSLQRSGAAREQRYRIQYLCGELPARAP
jgi:hypothetical protein